MKFILFFIFVFLSCMHGTGQDVVFSQFSNQPFVTNPAMPSLLENNTLSLSDRDQWRSNNVTLNTTAISFVKYLPWQIINKSPIILNSLILNDRSSAGAFNRSQVAISLISNVQLNSNFKLSTAIYLGIAQHTFNYNYYKWGLQYNGFKYDPAINSQEDFTRESFLNFDLGLGVLLNCRGGSLNLREKKLRFTIGYGMYHINNPKYTLIENYKDLYARKVLFGSLGGRIFSNFRWMYLLLWNKQGPDLLLENAIELDYLIDASKSIGIYISTNSNKSYFKKFINSSYLSYGLKIEVSRINIGFNYDNELSTGLQNTNFNAIEVSLKYRIFK